MFTSWRNSMSTFDVVAFLIDTWWESVADGKFYHTRLQLPGTNVGDAMEVFKTIAWKACPIREDNTPADGGMLLLAVTSWTADSGNPVTIILDRHEWSS